MLAVIDRDLVGHVVDREFAEREPIAEPADRAAESGVFAEVGLERIKHKVHVGSLPIAIGNLDLEDRRSPVHQANAVSVSVSECDFGNGRAVFGLPKGRGADGHAGRAKAY